MDTASTKSVRLLGAAVSMREAESIMHEQINRDGDCTFVAEEIRTLMR